MYLSFIVAGLGLLNVIFFLFVRDKDSSPIAIVSKTVSSLLFVLTGIFSFVYRFNEATLSSHDALFYILIIAGLICGMVGDIFLDFRVYFKSLYHHNEIGTDKSLLMTSFGISMFGVGHVFYLIALIYHYPTLWMYFLMAFGIAAIFMSFNQILGVKVLKNMNYRTHLLVCTVYGIILATFLFSAIFLFIKNPHSIGLLLLMIAAIFFSVSDYLLSIMYFSKDEKYLLPGRKNPEWRGYILINHATYYIAQFLIALAILFL